MLKLLTMRCEAARCVALACVAAFLSIGTPAHAVPPAAAAKEGLLSGPAVQVSLPIAEYEKLVGKPSVTVIDTLRLSGSFSGHDLSIGLSGRASGLFPKVELLSAPASISIYGCEGEAIVSKSTSGVFEIVPLAARFAVRCHLATSGSDRLQLDVTPSVLWIESQISDGEMSQASAGSDAASGRRTITVVRVSGGTGEILRPSATARYRITLQPEATLFTYQLEVMNPNRSHQPLTVELKSGEHVQKVDAAVSFEPNGNAYRFKLPPGEQTLTLHGTLPRPVFAPPVSASVHYLVIESHPLLRPNITTSAQRISAQETGLSTHFRGARGLLLSDSDTLSWQVAKLEALRTTSFAVNSATHRFFLSGDGQALGESMLSLDNQGAPALSLPMRAEPSFASLQNEPVLLTRDENSQLWLPLSHGQQDVLVQHHQTIRRFAGFALATLWLPDTQVPASVAFVELRYPREWVPLYEELSPELRLPVLDAGALFCLLLLFLWTERLLALLGAGRGFRFAVAGLLGFGALTSPWWMTLLCAADLTLSGVFAWPWLSRRKWNFWSVVGALVFGGIIFLIGATSLLFAPRGPAPTKMAPLPDSASYAPRGEKVPDGKPHASDDRASRLQGLPAKFVLPRGNQQSNYEREMLAGNAGSPRAVYVFLMSRPALGLFGSLLFGVGFLLLLARRRPLRRGFYELWQKLRQPPPAPPARES